MGHVGDGGVQVHLVDELVQAHVGTLSDGALGGAGVGDGHHDHLVPAPLFLAEVQVLRQGPAAVCRACSTLRRVKLLCRCASSDLGDGKIYQQVGRDNRA